MGLNAQGQHNTLRVAGKAPARGTPHRLIFTVKEADTLISRAFMGLFALSYYGWIAWMNHVGFRLIQRYLLGVPEKRLSTMMDSLGPEGSDLKRSILIKV